MNDHAGRDKLNDLDLDTWLAESPRLVASDAFTQKVMQNIMQRRQASLTSKIRRLILRPVIQFNLMQMATAAIAFFALGIGMAFITIKPVQPTVASLDPKTGTVMVGFEFHVKDARNVALVGDFDDWRHPIKMKKINNRGTWSVWIPLQPGSYEYMFVVDGKTWISDPHAKMHRNDGFGHRNAVLTVSSSVI